MNNKFKKGDKVVCIEAFTPCLGFGKLYEVELEDCKGVYVKRGGAHYLAKRFMHERDFVEMCINALRERSIGLYVNKDLPRPVYYDEKNATIEELLDLLYPTESEEQKELRKLEEEQRKLAERIAAVREKL